MTGCCLDISRTLSRIGRGRPTGIDRVELAYVRELARRDPGALGLVAIRDRFLLVPLSAVAAHLPELLDGSHAGRTGLRDAVRFKLPREQRKARSFLRRHAVARGTRPAALLRQHGVDVYFNVGHANLVHRHLAALGRAGIAVRVMVHDLIPLTHPQFTRPQVTAAFRDRMRAVAQTADLVICNSAATQAAVMAHFPGFGRVPETMVAHLGVEPLAMAHRPADPPTFVILGTIEPRKNHAMLLSVWERLAGARDGARAGAGAVPQLRIIGRRGWMNADVFHWLDTHPLSGVAVQEMRDLPDAALGAELSRARALLFPSFAEGFGLPALEAAQAGLPVICSDIPVFREVLGDCATFLDPGNADAWHDCIASVAKKPASRQDMPEKRPSIPGWDTHFGHVFRED